MAQHMQTIHLAAQMRQPVTMIQVRQQMMAHVGQLMMDALVMMVKVLK